MSLYEINLQREILREKSAEILADFNKYMRERIILIIQIMKLKIL